MQKIQEMWVQSLGGQDPQEEEMATHSSILTGRISYTEELVWLQSKGSKRIGHDWSNWAHTWLCKIKLCVLQVHEYIYVCVCVRLFLYKNLWSNNMIGKLFWIVFWQKEGEIQMWPGNVNEVDEMLITHTNLETMSSFFCYFIPEILSFTVSFSWCDIIYPVSSYCVE